MVLFIIWLMIFFGCCILYIIYNLIRIAASLIGFTSFELYHYLKVTKPMVKNGIIEKKQMEQRMIEEEKRQRNEEKINERRNKIIRTGINRVQELRIKYQYADESLFQLYLQKYPIYAVHELQEIENRIFASHLANAR